MAPIKAYESIFRIDNVPILPPLMTEEKRQKMRNYRDLAVALETKLKLERDIKTTTRTRKISDTDHSENDELSSIMTASTQKTTTTATTTIDNEYLQVSNLLKEITESKNQQQVDRTKDYLQNLSRSDLFICDVTSNTIMIPSQDDDDDDDDDDNGFSCVPLEVKNTFIKENEKIFKDTHSKDKKLNDKESTVQQKTVVQKSLSPVKLSSKRSYNDVQIQLKDSKEIPSITIEPPTPLKDKLQDQVIAELKEKIKSPLNTSSLSNDDQKQIIRSNSFTLDSPSNALIEHIIKCNNNQTDGGLRKVTPSPCTKTFHTINSKSPTKCSNVPLSSSSSKVQKPLKSNKFERKCLKSTSDTSKISSILMSSNVLFKNKRTPYDVKSICKTSKVLRKHKSHQLNKTTSTNTVIMKPSSVVQQQRNKNQRTPVRQKSQLNLRESFTLEDKNGDNNSKVSANNGSNFQQIKEMIEEIEDKHRTKLKELLQKQQEEQKLMQENFEKQQKMLLEKFTSGIKKNVTTTKNVTKQSRIKSVWSDEIYLSINKNALDYDDDDDDSEYGSSSYTSPMGPLSLKRVNSNDNLDTATTRSTPVTKGTPRRKLFPLNGGGGGGTPTSKKLFANPNLLKKEEKAVTKINAYARGYLTRRLFKSDHVQRIVQTIRDTLLFVLQLHMETRYDDTEDNIKLKARLLQQLTSACESLHKIFFEYSAKERMEIIAKDRKLLKSKANKLRG